MTDLHVEPARKPLVGVVRVPADKSITHRALMLAGLASGACRVSAFRMGEDNRSTANAMRALGVEVVDDGPDTLTIRGVGLEGLREPSGAIDCGNAGTSMRLDRKSVV